VNLAVHFRARSSLILNCSSESFLFFYYAACWSNGKKEENCGWEERGEIGEISLQ